MNSRDFCYWLQGWFELNGETVTDLPADKLKVIQNHLNMVFVHEIDPSFGGPEQQEKLNLVHLGPNGEELPTILSNVTKPKQKYTVDYTITDTGNMKFRC